FEGTGNAEEGNGSGLLLRWAGRLSALATVVIVVMFASIDRAFAATKPFFIHGNEVIATVEPHDSLSVMALHLYQRAGIQNPTIPQITSLVKRMEALTPSLKPNPNFVLPGHEYPISLIGKTLPGTHKIIDAALINQPAPTPAPTSTLPVTHFFVRGHDIVGTVAHHDYLSLMAEQLYRKAGIEHPSILQLTSLVKRMEALTPSLKADPSLVYAGHQYPISMIGEKLPGTDIIINKALINPSVPIPTPVSPHYPFPFSKVGAGKYTQGAPGQHLISGAHALTSHLNTFSYVVSLIEHNILIDSIMVLAVGGTAFYVFNIIKKFLQKRHLPDVVVGENGSIIDDRSTPYEKSRHLIEETEQIFVGKRENINEDDLRTIINKFREINNLTSYNIEEARRNFVDLKRIYERMEILSLNITRVLDRQYDMLPAGDTAKEEKRLYLIEFTRMAEYSATYESLAVAISNIELARGYRGKKNGFWEVSGIFSFVRAWYGFHMTLFFSSRKFEKSIEQLIETGNKIEPSLYENPEIVIQQAKAYIDNIPKKEDAIGTRKGWYKRQVGQRSVQQG
ncbi:MAG: hypothetical protein ABSH12_08855, partial [Endomicrobiales bacterium]